MENKLKVFLSHSLKDCEFAQNLTDYLIYENIEVLCAEHISEYNDTISNKIKKLIKFSDIGIVFLTEDGFKSNFVQQEIGYMEDKIEYVPIVDIRYKGKMTGFYYAKDFITFDIKKPDEVNDKLMKYLIKQKKILNKK